MLRVSLLGDFCVRYEEKHVTGIDTPRMQSLLAYLIVHRDAPQSRAHLSFLFWPDTNEAQARTNLRNLLHSLRHTLPDADSYLESSIQTIQWLPGSSFSLDLDDFENALIGAEQASQSNLAALQMTLERAVALYTGDLLPSCYDDWIIPPRERLHQAYLGVLERLVSLLEEKREYPAAIRYAQRLLKHDPLQEATYRHLIRLYALNGDRAGALRLYHTCTTILKRELDLAPSAATQEAYEQLLGVASRALPLVPTTTAGFYPLVGREREWSRMLQAWRVASDGKGARFVVFSGEAGIGKTRMVEELIQWATRQGVTCACTRCYAAEGDLAYAPVSAWLRALPMAALEDVWIVEVARLLPEVLSQRPDLPQPLALTEAWQRQRFFEALSHAIHRSRQPLLLTIDDLQWCDRDTLEWLHFLLRFDHNSRLLVVGAFRPEETGENHPLILLLQALRLEGQVTEVDLQPLDEISTKNLATLVAGEEIGMEAAQRLFRETEGNPLFVVETVRAGFTVHTPQVSTGFPRNPPSDNSGLPPKLRSMLEARLAQVSPPSRELAGLAATIGREFSFKLLVMASDRDENILVRELDELWQRRIVREHGLEGYDFSHDKLREVVYHSMSTARRVLLHRHVAQALERLHAADLGPVSHQVAAHFERAGLPEQAIPYYLHAATRARQVYANEDAISLLQHGLALVDDRKTGVDKDRHLSEIAAQLWEELGDVLELKARHEEALQAYRNAQTQAPPRGRLEQSRLHRKVGVALREQRYYAEAFDAFHEAEIVLGENPVPEIDDWWAEWIEVQVNQIWAYYWLAQWHEMEALVNKVKPVVQERGSIPSRTLFLMASILMHLRKYRYVISDEMLANQREALAAIQEWGNLKAMIECQFELGFLHLWRSELDESEKYLLTALEKAETSGVSYLQTLSLTYLTIVCRFRGQTESVLSYSMRAHEVAEEAHMPDYVAAAKGNLAWLAWRKRDLPEAEQRGREALILWQQSPLVYPFQWQALWPLIGVSLARDREEEAWAYAQALLEPLQQQLPERLNIPLAAAVQAKEQNQAGIARPLLDQAMEVALEMGYL